MITPRPTATPEVTDAAGGRAIDAVLFDLGRVLVRWDPYLPFAGRFDRADVDRFFAEVDFPAFNHAQDAGRPWAQAREELARTHPEHLPLLDTYVEHFAESVPGEVPGSAAVVDDLQAAGVRTLGLTNWSAETFHVAGEQAPVVTRLEAVLVSGEERVAKPDPAVFRLAVERFGLEPGRTLFTDDSPRNVEAAAALGFVTELFVDAVGVRARLAALGALPA